MPNSLLIVEDNVDIAHLVAIHARDIGCTVEIVADGNQALQLCKERDYDLVILDLMLPGRDGLDVCRELRYQPRYVPILILTSKVSELDRVLGLEIGADDYLTKPFSIAELKARIRAQLRRSEAQLSNKCIQLNLIQCGDLRINTVTRQAQVADRPIALTAREFELLTHFAQHPGRVYSRLQLLEQVWGYEYEGYEHTVNSHINRLRAKLEANPSTPRYIQTVWGVGYRFCESLP